VLETGNSPRNKEAAFSVDASEYLFGFWIKAKDSYL